MKYRTIRIAAVSTLLSAMCAGLALTGCSTSVANEEPGLGKVQAFLKQGDQDGYREARDYVDRLDTRSRNTLTPKMLKDDNPLVVYLGAARLVREKRYEEAAPVMAELIVTGGHGRELQTRMMTDWRQDADPATWPVMMSRVGRILMVNMESYLPDSRKRAEQFLVTALKLEVNKSFDREGAAAALMKLTRDVKHENS